MVKVEYHGRFTSGINKIDALKVRNIEKIVIDGFHDAFRLTFREFRKVTVVVKSLREMEGELERARIRQKKRMIAITLR